MTDRQALAAALGGPQSSWNPGQPLIIAAARQRLNQLPERCDDCVAGYVDIVANEERCPTCRGYARLWPEELVERIAEALVLLTFDEWIGLSQSLKDDARKMAIAVLAVLDGEAA